MNFGLVCFPFPAMLFDCFVPFNCCLFNDMDLSQILIVLTTILTLSRMISLH